MRFKAYSYICLILLSLAALVFIAWISSTDPQFNRASFEAEDYTHGLADPEVAITLAQYRADSGEVVTLLVEANIDGQIHGIDLADLGALREDDAFSVLASARADILSAAFSTSLKRHKVAVSRLLPTGPKGNQHIGIGTNFPEHTEEANSDSVFVFPKFGSATPARTTVAAPEGSLLDYEVELCMRFDRPIESLEDFDQAIKALFLCADFTDRIALLDLVDPDNLDSGYGFSDAKSGLGFFPTGPFLVFPKDWASFTANIRMMTLLNDEARQDARGHEMTLDFRALAEKALSDMQSPRFFYAGEFYKLAPNQRIDPEMTLMSGTAEGVIFTPPARHDYIEAAIAYFLKGGPLSRDSLRDTAVAIFVENELASGHFLKPGDTVTYQASLLGEIVV